MNTDRPTSRISQDLYAEAKWVLISYIYVPSKIAVRNANGWFFVPYDVSPPILAVLVFLDVSPFDIKRCEKRYVAHIPNDIPPPATSAELKLQPDYCDTCRLALYKFPARGRVPKMCNNVAQAPAAKIDT